MARDASTTSLATAVASARLSTSGHVIPPPRRLFSFQCFSGASCPSANRHLPPASVISRPRSAETATRRASTATIWTWVPSATLQPRAHHHHHYHQLLHLQPIAAAPTPTRMLAVITRSSPSGSIEQLPCQARRVGTSSTLATMSPRYSRPVSAPDWSQQLPVTTS